MKEESIHQKKLNKLLQQELSDILSRELVYVPGVMLTVSQVRITADLSLARVYITALPDSKLQELVAALEDRAWEVRHALSRRIKNKLRKMPEIRFYEDDSFIEAQRISNLLDELDIKPEEEEGEEGEA